jgi:hypothetical protein
LPKQPVDIEALRKLFEDTRQHIAVGRVTKLGLADDRSCLRIQVALFPEEREIVAQMGFDSLGDGTGWLHMPEVGDMVVVAFHDGDPDEFPAVVGRFPNKTHKLPAKMTAGHLTGIARPGKHIELESDTKIHARAPRVNLAKTDADPTEPLVLGNVNVTFMTNLIDAFLNAPQIGWDALNIPVFLDPQIRQLLVEYKQTYLDDASTNILSQLSFTERGGS